MPQDARRIYFYYLKTLFLWMTSCSFFANPSELSSFHLSPLHLAQEFKKSVPIHLEIPPEDVLAYINGLDQALQKSHIQIVSSQYLILVDRNQNVQVAMIFFGGTEQEPWQFIGATSVSTGLPGTFEHFLTPLGVFAHSLENLDFRAEGTKNEFGFRGYGAKGMRVYDFGWVKEPQGWGKKVMAIMRLQMHATDPDFAENLLGIPRSKGCIRISASLNQFIDVYGLIDADYDAAIISGRHFWVLSPNRQPTTSSGRYLVVIESNLKARPEWASLPKNKTSMKGTSLMPDLK